MPKFQERFIALNLFLLKNKKLEIFLSLKLYLSLFMTKLEMKK